MDMAALAVAKQSKYYPLRSRMLLVGSSKAGFYWLTFALAANCLLAGVLLVCWWPVVVGWFTGCYLAAGFLLINDKLVG